MLITNRFSSINKDSCLVPVEGGCLVASLGEEEKKKKRVCSEKKLRERSEIPSSGIRIDQTPGSTVQLYASLSSSVYLHTRVHVAPTHYRLG